MRNKGPCLSKPFFWVFLETVKHHGFDKMIFRLLPDHKQIGLKVGVRPFLRIVPGDWMAKDESVTETPF